MQQGVDRFDDLVGIFAGIAGEITELAQDDVDADAGEKAAQHGVGDEAGEEAEFQQARRQHEDAGQQREHRQRSGHKDHPQKEQRAPEHDG